MRKLAAVILLAGCLPPEEVRMALRDSQPVALFARRPPDSDTPEVRSFVAFETEAEMEGHPGRGVCNYFIKGKGPYARVYIESRGVFEVRRGLERFGEPQRDGLALLRNRINIDSDNIHGLVNYLVQFQDARDLNEREGWEETTNVLDVRQAYLQWGDDRSVARVKLGREQLDFGSGRLVGSDWRSNIDRTFDAAHATWADSWKRFSPFEHLWRVDLFAGREVGVDPEAWDASHTGPELYGLFYEERRAHPHSILASLLFYRGEHADIVGEKGGEGRLGVFVLSGGLRADELGGFFDYDGELALQGGENGPDPHAAAALHASCGFTVTPVRKVRLAVAVDFATGDRDPGDGRSDAFLQPFGNGREQLGLSGLVSWRNHRSVALTVGARPWKGARAEASYRFIRLDSSRDSWYDVLGREVWDAEWDAGGTVGEELDLFFRHFFPGGSWVEAAYARFWGGGVASAAGVDQHARFYVSVGTRW